MNALWRIDLLGGLQLTRAEGEVISRFQTRKTGALLAYLAFYREKVVSRDVLADLFWPDNDPDASRNSLRVALTSLRRQVEPPGIPAGGVLVADRASVHLNATSFSTDVADFEAAVRSEKIAEDDEGRTTALLHAVELYRGPLLSGWYEEWIDVEQTRLAEVYASALRRVTTLLTRSGDYERALHYAQRAVTADPLREETNRNLMRLFAVLGQPAAAREQYRKLESRLLKELGSSPSTATRELMKQITAGAEKLIEAAAAKGLREPPVPASDNAAEPASEKPATTAVAPAKAPTAATVSHAVGNVPMQFTRFIGREAELLRLEELFSPGSETRVVTLTGPGGTGKTRLAVEMGTRLRDKIFGGRVWVIPLADLTEAAQLPTALLGGLRCNALPDIAPLDQIEAELGKVSNCLLILDNLEQIAESGAPVIEELLRRLPNLAVLATSRQHLGIRGEREFLVSPLPTPPVGLDALESLSINPGVALFLDRARAVRPDFQITPRNAFPIAELVRRLDGLPLALELAAAGVRLLAPQQMLDRLRDRSDLLSSDRRDQNARHRSLRAVMDESYRLLPAEAHGFFARLSVFRGGWTLDAACVVCEEEDALELIDLLQQRSLVVSSDEPDGVRFRLLETICQYAESHLTPEEGVAIRAAHARYFVDFAEEWGEQLRGPASASASDQLEAEHENLRLAMATLLASDESRDLALRLANALWRFWYACGYADEGSRALEMAIERAGDHFAPLVRRAREGAGRLALNAGNARAAVHHFEQSGEDDPSSETDATLLVNRAIAAEACGDDAIASDAFRKLASYYRRNDDPWAELGALSSLGTLLQAKGDGDAASLLSERIDICRRLVGEESTVDGDNAPSGIAGSFLQLGHVAGEQGDFAVALPLLRDALTAYQQIGDERGAAIAQERIACVALRQGDIPAAHRAAEEALLLRRHDRSGRAKTAEESSATTFVETLLQRIETRVIL